MRFTRSVLNGRGARRESRHTTLVSDVARPSGRRAARAREAALRQALKKSFCTRSTTGRSKSDTSVTNSAKISKRVDDQLVLLKTKPEAVIEAI